MTGKEIVKKLMGEKGFTNADMAKSLNITQAALWDRLNPKKTDNMTVSKLNTMLSLMGYKIAIIPEDSSLPDGSYQVEQ